jgi:uncharacterized UBP type Zn finger protein
MVASRDLVSRQAVTTCNHIDQIRDPAALTAGCRECEALGQTPVAVRKCLVCGHVGCCDSTPGQHARAHFHATGHPLIEPVSGRKWTWCYIDDAYVNR